MLTKREWLTSKFERVLGGTAVGALIVASLAGPVHAQEDEKRDEGFVLTAAATTVSALEAMAIEDPESVAKLGMERYDREIRDYRATFIKQELVNGKLGPVEEIEILFAEKPRSVFMIWKQNAGDARRVLYRDTPDFRERDGTPVAKVEPAGAVIRLLVSEVKIPIHGDRAKKSSRRAIDEFGFRHTLHLLEKYNGISREAGLLDYRYVGHGEIDGRPTFVFHRHLPYRKGGPYPDAKLIMHLDQEWLLPVAVYSYADREARELLGSYVFKNVKINTGLTERDFQF